MEFKDVINKRKSIRSFEKRKVSRKILKELIVDASKAPSAGNWQPWYFYVVDSKNKRDKLSELLRAYLKGNKEVKKLSKKLKDILFNFYSDLGNCQQIILVYIDKEKNKTYRNSKILSVVAAIENLMLSAVNKGLGTCWIGTFKQMENKVNRISGVKKKELVAGILVGYPAEDFKPLNRKKKKLSEILKFI